MAGQGVRFAINMARKERQGSSQYHNGAEPGQAARASNWVPAQPARQLLAVGTADRLAIVVWGMYNWEGKRIIPGLARMDR